MNTFIYISLALYIPFMTWFLIMAWRCRSPAFGKTELTLLGLLEITNVAVYSAWLIPLHAGWLIKLTLMCVFSCINMTICTLIHWRFSPFRFTLSEAFADWMGRCSITAFQGYEVQSELQQRLAELSCLPMPGCYPGLIPNPAKERRYSHE